MGVVLYLSKYNVINLGIEEGILTPLQPCATASVRYCLFRLGCLKLNEHFIAIYTLHS